MLIQYLPWNALFGTLTIPTKEWKVKRFINEMQRLCVKCNVKLLLSQIVLPIEAFFHMNDQFRGHGVCMEDFVSLR